MKEGLKKIGTKIKQHEEVNRKEERERSGTESGTDLPLTSDTMILRYPIQLPKLYRLCTTSTTIPPIPPENSASAREP